MTYLRMDLLHDQVDVLKREHDGHLFNMAYWLIADDQYLWTFVSKYPPCKTAGCALGTALLFAPSWNNVPQPSYEYLVTAEALGMTMAMFAWLYTDRGWKTDEGARFGFPSLGYVPKERVIRRLEAVLRREQRRRTADRVEAINEDLKRLRYRKWEWTREQFADAAAGPA